MYIDIPIEILENFFFDTPHSLTHTHSLSASTAEFHFEKLRINPLQRISSSCRYYHRILRRFLPRKKIFFDVHTQVDFGILDFSLLFLEFWNFSLFGFSFEECESLIGNIHQYFFGESAQGM